MMRYNKAILILLLFSFTMFLCSCKAVKDAVPSEPRTIVFDDRVYSEVEQETVQALSLTVESSEGLTAIGEAEDQESGSSLKAFIYPDTRYPNLIVICIDDQPKIYQFSNFKLSYCADIEEVKNIYGFKNSEAISKISVSKQNVYSMIGDEHLITDRVAINSFYEALNSLKPISEGYREEVDSLLFPSYYLKIYLSNGFSLTVEYYPQLEHLYHGNTFYTYEKAMSSWLASHT